MKFARVGQPGLETPVVVADDGRLLDLTSVPADIDPDAFVARVVGPIWFSVFGPGSAVDDAFVERCVDVALAGTVRSGG